jgi:ribokinase
MIIKMTRIPKPGETVLGGKFFTAAGGKGANQAVAAARAGGNVTFIARLGDDSLGRQAVNGFIKDKINTDYILFDKTAPSGVALIFVAHDGENSIAVASGANANLSPSDILKAKTAIASADVLVMQLETPLETVKKAASIAAAKGVKVILNPAPGRALDKNILQYVSVLTPNESEAEILTGIRVANTENAVSAANTLMEKGVQTVIITMGPKGAFVASDSFTGLVEGFKVKAIDTTAAGDVFNGALSVALAEGRPLNDAVLFANAAAALSVTKLGAQPSAPARKDIDKFLSHNRRHR